jgi:hypothetical protein
MSALEFTSEELAAGMYRLMLANAQAVGDEGVPDQPWDGLSFEEQAPWLTLANKAPTLLESLEHATFDVVAFKLFSLIQDPSLAEDALVERYGQMHKLYHLMWEAIARFVHAAIDSEDGSLSDAFDVFSNWFKRKADAVPRILTTT